MIDTKKTGRPRKFDEEVALNAAIETFWVKGYNGASIKDLTKAMGINSPSLYAAYGDKETLFIKAVEHYMNTANCEPFDVFNNENDIQKSVREFFKTIIACATNEEQEARGCFIGSCVITSAETVLAIKPILQNVIDMCEELIVSRFERAIKDGQLPQNFPSRQRARLLFDLRQGMVFRARSGVPSHAMSVDIDCWADLVLA